MGTDMMVKTVLFLVFGSVGVCFLTVALCVWLSVRSKCERCSRVVPGKVVRYSAASYGECGVHLPVVEYEIDGTVYRKTGPKYSFTSVSISSPFIKENTREYSTDIYAQNFKVKTRTNSFAGVIRNPMNELFPLGSEIEVHYDPRKPKRAYVLRPYKCGVIIKVFAIIGAIFAAVACIACII